MFVYIFLIMKQKKNKENTVFCVMKNTKNIEFKEQISKPPSFSIFRDPKPHEITDPVSPKCPNQIWKTHKIYIYIYKIIFGTLLLYNIVALYRNGCSADCRYSSLFILFLSLFFLFFILNII